MALEVMVGIRKQRQGVVGDCIGIHGCIVDRDNLSIKAKMSSIFTSREFHSYGIVDAMDSQDTGCQGYVGDYL
jgi:hypothetical protein